MAHLLKLPIFFLMLTSQIIIAADGESHLRENHSEAEEDDEDFSNIVQGLDGNVFEELTKKELRTLLEHTKHNDFEAVTAILDEKKLDPKNPLTLEIIQEALKLESPKIASFLVESLHKSILQNQDVNLFLSHSTSQEDLPNVLKALACQPDITFKKSDVLNPEPEEERALPYLPTWSLSHSQNRTIQKLLLIYAANCRQLAMIDAHSPLITHCRAEDLEMRGFLVRLGCNEPVVESVAGQILQAVQGDPVVLEKQPSSTNVLTHATFQLGAMAEEDEEEDDGGLKLHSTPPSSFMNDPSVENPTSANKDGKELQDSPLPSTPVYFPSIHSAASILRISSLPSLSRSPSYLRMGLTISSKGTTQPSNPPPVEILDID